MQTSQPNGRARARLLSVDMVAAELGVSTKTIRRQIASGALPAHRIGRCLRVAEDDLARYRSQRRA